MSIINVRLLPAALCLLMPLTAVAAPASENPASRRKEELLRKCMADFSIDVIARSKTPPLVYGTRSPIPGMVDGIRRYYECEAFSRRDPSLCKALPRYRAWESYGDKIKTTNKPDDLEAYCRSVYNLFNVIKIIASGRPDAAKACEALPFSREELGETSLQDECGWMTAGEPEAHCKSPIAPELGVREIEDCVSHYVLHADEGKCLLIQNAPLTEGARQIYGSRCRDAAAYRKAYQAKNAGLCGDSLGCRMLMGEKVCERHLDQLRTEFCRSWAQGN